MADQIPLETPWNQYGSPQVLDDLLVEVVDPEKTGYVELPSGSPYPNYKAWPLHRLVFQQAQTKNRLTRIWSNDPVAQSEYSYDVGFSGEDPTKPLFTRRYLVRRDAFVPSTKEQPFTGIYLVAVLDGGSGYNPAVPPDVVISGTGTGATARAVVDAAGHVAWISLTSEGTSYTSASVSFSSVQGSGASAAAILQSSNTVLVKEQAQELPADNPRRSLYLLVTRVFETLPGPTLVDWEYIRRINQKARIAKTIVLTSSIPVDPNSVVETAGTITEWAALPDRYRSIEIISSISSTPPATIVYYGSTDFSFPDELRSATFIYRGTLVGDSSFDYGLGLATDIEDGFSGPCLAKISEHFVFEPTLDWFETLPQVTAIYPRRGTIWASFQAQIGTSARADVASFSIPSTLHPAISVGRDTNGMPGIGAGGTTGLTATTPTTIPKGSWIVRHSIPERLEFGLWVVRVIEIQKPNIP